MAFICMFFPAVIMCGVRRMAMKEMGQNNRDDWKYLLLEYVCCCVFLNLLLFVFLAVFRNNKDNIYSKLNASSIFAIKYLLSAVSAAAAVPFLERYLRRRLAISCDLSISIPEIHIPSIRGEYRNSELCLLAAAAIGLHFFRIFDNVFWYDEILPCLTERMNWKEMLNQVARWGHTPLHYIIIWVICRVFGHSGTLHHFVSFVPYLIIVLTAATVVRKWFGTRTAAILILLSALLENAVRYNVEVRMYSWCQMFIFLAYLMMYQILRTKKVKYFVYMMFCSLGAVYSHYFALASIGMLYLFLLLYMVRADGKAAWKVLLSGGMVPLGLLPWMWYGHHVRGQLVAHYSALTKLSWKTCFEYIFFSKYSLFILLMFLCVFAVFLFYGSGIVRSKRLKNGKILVSVFINQSKWKFSYELIWCLAGVSAAFGTIIASQWISDVLYPITLVRYLYPAFILAWLVFGICISKCKLKKLLTLVLVLVLMFSCVPAYYRVVKNERKVEAVMENTLAATDEIAQGDYIMTNIGHLDWAVLSYYYPNTEHALFSGDSLPEFYADKDNWLFLGSPISEDIVDCLKERGSLAELVVSNGYVGTYQVWIYKVVGD